MLRNRIKDYIWSYNACDQTAARAPWRHFLQIMLVTAGDFWDGLLNLRAMGLVYTTLLAMVPLLAVGISVLKGFGVHDQLEPTLASLLAPLGDKSVELASRIIDFVENINFGVLGAVGLVLLIYTAVSLIQKIESAFNYTWHLTNSRSLIRRFSDYLSVLMIGPVLVFAAVAITASLGSHHLVAVLGDIPYLRGLVGGFGKILPYLLIIAAFTFVYLVVPNTRVAWRSALYGGLVAGILWELAGILFRNFVVGSTNYSAIYSGFAILLVFLIWLYVSWAILLIGASISFYHQNPEYLKLGAAGFPLSARMRDQLALQAMVDIGRAHDRQSELPPTLENLANQQQVPVQMLARVLAALEADGLVRQTAGSPPRYLPGRSIRRIGVIDILASARAAEDDGRAGKIRCDELVTELLHHMEREVIAVLRDNTLADLIDTTEDIKSDEDRLV